MREYSQQVIPYFESYEFNLIAFFLLFRLHAAQQWCEIDFYETYSTFFFSMSDKSASELRSCAACAVRNAGRFCACEWVIDSTRACVCSECEGCRNAEWERVKPDRPMALPLCVRHSLSSSGLKTAEKKRAMAGAPLSLFLSLSRALLSPFFRVWRRRRKKTSNKKRDSFANVQQPIRVPHGALGEEERRERGWEEIKV